jgi:hypothetical protein
MQQREAVMGITRSSASFANQQAQKAKDALIGAIDAAEILASQHSSSVS